MLTTTGWITFPRLMISIGLLAALRLTANDPAQFGGPPGGGGPGGPGGPGAPDIEVVDRFDHDKDKRLNTAERSEAREWLAGQQGQRRGGPGGPGGPGGRGRGRGGRGGRGRGPGGPGGGSNRPEGSIGPEVNPADVAPVTDASLYDTSVLRTVFLEFENEGWEQELADFKPTDVEVPATMIVDGKTYPDVGVSFRGASSFFTIPEGSKRSLNLSIDFVNDDQRLYGYKSLNLLNCNGDASMMSSLLYHDIASKQMAAPKVNFLKVVINGRSWGVYANAQQFNKDFLKENYGSKKGARWKVDGSPQGDGGLRYLGEELEQYKERFDLKSKESEQAWKDLVNLCKVLNETPVEDLETALKPILDIDSTLWFLAVDIALINSDGYWTRASDYSIYQNEDGVFHVLPHDMNEAFRAARGGPGGGPGGRGGGPPGGRRGGFGFFGPPPGGPPPESGGGPGQGRDGGRGPGGEGQAIGFKLDPLTGVDEERFPLRSKLLGNPKLRKRYLQYVKLIADEYLDWEYLGPKVAAARQLIQDEVKADTRKLMTYEAFQSATGEQKGALRQFCDERSKYLLSLPAIKELPAE